MDLKWMQTNLIYFDCETSNFAHDNSASLSSWNQPVLENEYNTQEHNEMWLITSQTTQGRLYHWQEDFN